MHSYLHGHPALIQAVRRLESLGLDQFELWFTRRASTRIEVREGKVDSLLRAEDLGLSVRVIRDSKTGFSYTTSLQPASIDRAIDTANEIAALMPADPDAGLFSFGSAVYPAIDALDSRSLALPTEKKIEMALSLERQVRAADARVRVIRKAQLSENQYEVHMVDSSGEHLHHQGTMYSATVTCKAEDAGGDAQMGGDFVFSPWLDTLDLPLCARNAAREATELLGATRPSTFKGPAVLRNSVVASLLGFLASSFSAEEVEKNRSLLKGKLGQKIFAEGITLIDDSLLPGGAATRPFDGEGVPSRTTRLVDGGILSAYLADVKYGRKLGIEPTSSAERGIKGPPRISTTNFYLPSGRKSPDALMAGIGRGILITDLMGVHTANRITGDFSLGASGILIENGRLTRPVKGFAVAGNVLTLFRQTIDVANDLRFFGGIGAPSILVSELSVGGS